MANQIFVNGTQITVATIEDKDYISLTDMLKAKDGDFFISDWLRNRNTVEFLGIWEQIHNPDFNYGEFAIIKMSTSRDFPTKRHAGFEVCMSNFSVFNYSASSLFIN